MLKRGWQDDEDEATRKLKRYKASNGLADPADILTFFDYCQVDEGRKLCYVVL